MALRVSNSKYRSTNRNRIQGPDLLCRLLNVACDEQLSGPPIGPNMDFFPDLTITKKEDLENHRIDSHGDHLCAGHHNFLRFEVDGASEFDPSNSTSLWAEISSQCRLASNNIDMTLIEQGRQAFTSAYKEADRWDACVKMTLWLEKSDGSGTSSGEPILSGTDSKMVRCTLRVGFWESTDREIRSEVEGLYGDDIDYQRWDMILEMLNLGIKLAFSKDGTRKPEDNERGYYSEEFCGRGNHRMVKVDCIDG